MAGGADAEREARCRMTEAERRCLDQDADFAGRRGLLDERKRFELERMAEERRKLEAERREAEEARAEEERRGAAARITEARDKAVTRVRS